MSARARIAAFATLLAAIFAAAVLAGHAVDPGSDSSDGRGAGHAADSHAGDPHAPGAATAPATAAHGTAASAHSTAGADGATSTANGLASSQSGYRLVATTTRFTAGRPGPLRFRILDAAGETVRAFQTEQARRMHLILVRRDLRGYQHLHPAQETGGGWTIDLTLPAPGVYRAFADFRTSDTQHVLGIDLFAPGDFRPQELPPRSDRASVDGYDVSLHAHAPGELTFAVTRSGKPVTDLQPYLGARGHLVALRKGDLAYRHSHPVASTAGEIAFASGETEPGTRRLFLQFRHRDRVHTAAFTR